MKVRIELTANHMGYFEFRLCPNNNAKRPASQACLDQNVLTNANTGSDRYCIYQQYNEDGSFNWRKSFGY